LRDPGPPIAPVLRVWGGSRPEGPWFAFLKEAHFAKQHRIHAQAEAIQEK
jgi:hypothetical protein